MAHFFPYPTVEAHVVLRIPCSPDVGGPAALGLQSSTRLRKTYKGSARRQEKTGG